MSTEDLTFKAIQINQSGSYHIFNFIAIPGMPKSLLPPVFSRGKYEEDTLDMSYVYPHGTQEELTTVLCQFMNFAESQNQQINLEGATFKFTGGEPATTKTGTISIAKQITLFDPLSPGEPQNDEIRAAAVQVDESGPCYVFVLLRTATTNNVNTMQIHSLDNSTIKFNFIPHFNEPLQQYPNITYVGWAIIHDIDNYQYIQVENYAPIQVPEVTNLF